MRKRSATASGRRQKRICATHTRRRAGPCRSGSGAVAQENGTDDLKAAAIDRQRKHSGVALMPSWHHHARERERAEVIRHPALTPSAYEEARLISPAGRQALPCLRPGYELNTQRLPATEEDRAARCLGDPIRPASSLPPPRLLEDRVGHGGEAAVRPSVTDSGLRRAGGYQTITDAAPALSEFIAPLLILSIYK